MPKLNLTSYDKIYYYKSVLSGTKKIIDFIDNDKKEWEWYSTKPNDEEPYLKSSYEFSEYKNINHFDKLKKDIKKYIDHYCESNNIELITTTELTANRCYPGKRLGPHNDAYDSKTSPFLTILTYLNDNYEGGELVFMDRPFAVKPLAGSIIIFPCTDKYVHQSNLIKSGIKQVITQFGFKK